MNHEILRPEAEFGIQPTGSGRLPPRRSSAWIRAFPKIAEASLRQKELKSAHELSRMGFRPGLWATQLDFQAIAQAALQACLGLRFKQRHGGAARHCIDVGPSHKKLTPFCSNVATLISFLQAKGPFPELGSRVLTTAWGSQV